MTTIRYVTDATGQTTDVLVPIKLWRELFADAELDETERIMTNPIMYKWVIDAVTQDVEQIAAGVERRDGTLFVEGTRLTVYEMMEDIAAQLTPDQMRQQ